MRYKYFYKNPEEIERMGKKAHHLAQNYTFEKYAERIYKTLKVIAKKESIK